MAKKEKKRKSAIAFKDSIKTKLIAVMLAVTIVPLVVAVYVSYYTSTKKARTDAEVALDWSCWYIQSEFNTIVSNNLKTIQAVGLDPSTVNFMGDQDNPIYLDRAQNYLQAVDDMLNDGNITVLTGPDGMQVLRNSGKLVDVGQRDYFKQAMQGKTAVSDIIVSTSTGVRQFTMAAPIIDKDVNDSLSALADGRFDKIDKHTNRKDEFGLMIGNTNSVLGKLEEIVGRIKASAASVATSSEELADTANQISQTTEAVSNINDKVAGITSIATQTNLLSLNASIEAARAGEAGKGFAVVAEEIGQLADNSKEMADEIRKEMDVLLEQATAAVTAAEDVKQGNMEQQVALGDTLEAVNGMLEDIRDTVGGVRLISDGADTCETSKNAVVDTMSALSAISEENAASSEETGASMQELSATVTTLATSADALKGIAEALNEDMSFFK